MLDRFRCVVASILIGLALPAQAHAEEDPAFLTTWAGGFDVFDDGGSSSDGAAEFGLQYRSDQKLWIFKPHAGVMATTDGAFYGFGGVLVDVYFGNRWVLTPTTAVGYYNEDAGTHLGSDVEFRSGIELAYRFDNRMRLGAGLYHMSNAGIGDENPGIESVTVNFSVPTTLIFGGKN